uniref:WRKY19-like zinc finger domain-containing protein n=1 Tax=Mucochytrium quahogii TaxID=96639 RepID=A0A7S2WEV9_9STRA|mmetsp:Transcript_2406/g.4720  ORF Transcript_2406/g.4720 Transcript_2406/m.4720 type:complete len:677 (+) Transcript_2406:89-2119(+)
MSEFSDPDTAPGYGLASGSMAVHVKQEFIDECSNNKRRRLGEDEYDDESQRQDSFATIPAPEDFLAPPDIPIEYEPMEDRGLKSTRRKRKGDCVVEREEKSADGQVTKILLTKDASGQLKRKRVKMCTFVGGCDRAARGSSALCISHGGGRRCTFSGCSNGAEGGNGSLYCKRHGGGRRCKIESCTRSARGGTMYCISHGGGRRCEDDGCTKAAVGSTLFCISHGGGKRCQFALGCTKAAQGSTNLCKSHGGGRRCQYPACFRSAEGSTRLCISHGGGRRCQFGGCGKSAQGKTMLCKAHGGGRRCDVEGCTKSAQGATNFCKKHGGGKRCQFPGCEKSARGRTDLCISHGGGKRCARETCEKSAVGSTEFCISHGGGRRCILSMCTKSARGGSNFCRAHGVAERRRYSKLSGVEKKIALAEAARAHREAELRLHGRLPSNASLRSHNNNLSTLRANVTAQSQITAQSEALAKTDALAEALRNQSKEAEPTERLLVGHGSAKEVMFRPTFLKRKSNSDDALSAPADQGQVVHNLSKPISEELLGITYMPVQTQYQAEALYDGMPYAQPALEGTDSSTSSNVPARDVQREVDRITQMQTQLMSQQKQLSDLVKLQKQTQQNPSTHILEIQVELQRTQSKLTAEMGNLLASMKTGDSNSPPSEETEKQNTQQKEPAIQ